MKHWLTLAGRPGRSTTARRENIGTDRMVDENVVQRRDSGSYDRRVTRMTAQRALGIVHLLTEGGVDTWVDGGWGVDALVGAQTREHGDLDLGVVRSDLDRAIELLASVGYAVSDDRYRQVTVQLTHKAGHRIDLHPSTRLPDGGTEQIGFDDKAYYIPPPVAGHIGGEAVRCMPAPTQLRGHEGYDLRPEDHHDIKLLRELIENPTAHTKPRL